MVTSLNNILFALFSLSGVTALLLPNFETKAKIFFWTDLQIGEQIQLITGIVLMAITTTVAIVIFKSVWVRKGYEGLDQMLEAKEVATMISHVIAFACLVSYQYLLVFNAYMSTPFPDFAYWITASGFLGPEVYLLFQFFKSIKIVKHKEDHHGQD
jgi:hypothetical protein